MNHIPMKHMKRRLKESTTTINVKDGVAFLTYHIFDGLPLTCAISTRLGGVSTGYFGTMNMSTTRGDDPENVRKNHILFAKAVGYDEKKLVMSDQIHETKILRVDRKDAGGGVIERGVDGLMTDVPGIPLMSFYADCVPLMIYDKKNHVCAMAHSGWRGTVKRIGEVCITRMAEEYGSVPKDLMAAVGPSICRDCYEVDEPVRTEFYDVFGKNSDDWFVPSDKQEHYMLDLAEACRYILMNAGVPGTQIAMPDLCTCCNPEFLFSHRASGGKRGNISVVMVLGD